MEQISAELAEQVARLRAGNPKARHLQPAAVTVSNLGACRVDSFLAVINPPEAAILAIGRIAPQPVVVDGEIVARRQVTLTLSADHRVVNGKYAAQFLEAVAANLESL